MYQDKDRSAKWLIMHHGDAVLVEVESYPGKDGVGIDRPKESIRKDEVDG